MLIQDTSDDDNPLKLNTGHLFESVESHVYMGVLLTFGTNQYKVIVFLTEGADCDGATSGSCRLMP